MVCDGLMLNIGYITKVSAANQLSNFCTYVGTEKKIVFLFYLVFLYVQKQTTDM